MPLVRTFVLGKLSRPATKEFVLLDSAGFELYNLNKDVGYKHISSY